MINHSDRSARVIAVTSGKGGVGKTNVSVNLSVALARMGRRTMLVDGDFGLANANILLGVDPSATIADLVTSDCDIPDIVQQGPGGVFLVPGHSGTGALAELDRSSRRRLADAFRPYAAALDTVIVDTATGISPHAMGLVAASDTVLLVLSDEPTAFMDAYALVKVLTLEHDCAAVSVVTNMVADAAAGAALFRRFCDVVAKFLPADLVHLGSIPRDHHVREAVFRKRCVVDAFPDCAASMAFLGIARMLSREPAPLTPGGSIFFGMEARHGLH